MARRNTIIGDVFCVIVDEKSKKYLQYIVSDLTQLNSDVIRAFKKSYSINEDPDLLEIVKGEVDFYAHCVTKWGIEFGIWEKVGNVPPIGKIEVLFKSSGDYGNPEIKISQDWWVWKVNEEQRRVGKLEGENKKAEIGSVIQPSRIAHRMKTGKYDFVYPAFE